MATSKRKQRKLTDIGGISDANAEKLKEYGIQSADDLVAKAGTTRERKKISLGTGIEARKILEWANRAELLMIEGIGPDYADLLEKAGVASVPELVLRDPKRLREKMVEVNEQKELVRRVPSDQELARWIRRALKSPRRRSY